MNQLQGVSIHVNGIVQGVGFRPFVFGLANKLKLVILKSWSTVITATGKLSMANL